MPVPVAVQLLDVQVGGTGVGAVTIGFGIGHRHCRAMLAFETLRAGWTPVAGLARPGFGAGVPAGNARPCRRGGRWHGANVYSFTGAAGRLRGLLGFTMPELGTPLPDKDIIKCDQRLGAWFVTGGRFKLCWLPRETLPTVKWTDHVSADWCAPFFWWAVP